MEDWARAFSNFVVDKLVSIYIGGKADHIHIKNIDSEYYVDGNYTSLNKYMHFFNVHAKIKNQKS